MNDFSKFQVIGYSTEYYVIRMAPNYPLRTKDKAVAEAFAKKTGRTVLVNQVPVYGRVA